jgi:hypothetical protein
MIKFHGKNYIVATIDDIEIMNWLLSSLILFTNKRLINEIKNLKTQKIWTNIVGSSKWGSNSYEIVENLRKRGTRFEMKFHFETFYFRNV